MSTNSIIATATSTDGTQFCGRYCHWDGYPSHMGKSLWEIVRRDGVEQARKVLVEDNTEWSSIDPQLTSENVEHPGTNTKVIDGYGRTYTDNSDSMEFTTNDMEYTYVLMDKGLRIFAGDSYTIVIPYFLGEVDWDAVQNRIDEEMENAS